MYKFNLEPLLDHRRYQEEVLQKELALSSTHLAREENKLRWIQQERKKYALGLQHRQRQDVLVSEIQLYIGYLERLVKDLEKQRQRVQVAQEKVDLKRNELIDTMKKRKALERLKEKGRHQFQLKMRKRERNFMDEVASVRYSRRG